MLNALKLISLLLASRFASAQLPDPNAYSCPDGFIKSNGTIYGIIGANANDVSSVIGDFLVLREPPLLTFRELELLPPKKSQLLSYTKLPTGVLKWLFKLANEYAPGEFYGYWIGLESLPISDHETSISWGSVICSSKQVFDFATTHEFGINQTIQILQDEGKITGVNQYPFSLASVHGWVGSVEKLTCSNFVAYTEDNNYVNAS
ncbi:hypothetical protein CI102_7125 [Trichoderma harzianum]|nr:hypothetical protein CI102_7125 [Trichoderma harzianum]